MQDWERVVDCSFGCLSVSNSLYMAFSQDDDKTGSVGVVFSYEISPTVLPGLQDCGGSHFLRITYTNTPKSPQDHPQYLAPSRITPTNTETFSLEAMDKNVHLPFHSTNWSTSESPSLPWHQRLPTQSLIFHDSTACTTMSRNTFILFVLLSQCRHMYCFDGPAGLRLGFGGYSMYSERYSQTFILYSLHAIDFWRYGPEWSLNMHWQAMRKSLSSTVGIRYHGFGK